MRASAEKQSGEHDYYDSHHRHCSHLRRRLSGHLAPTSPPKSMSSAPRNTCWRYLRSGPSYSSPGAALAKRLDATKPCPGVALGRSSYIILRTCDPSQRPPANQTPRTCDRQPAQLAQSSWFSRACGAIRLLQCPVRARRLVRLLRRMGRRHIRFRCPERKVVGRWIAW